MGKHEPSKDVSLKVNGQHVELNKFVGEFLKGAVRGILKSLKGMPQNLEKIEIIIDEEKKG